MAAEYLGQHHCRGVDYADDGGAKFRPLASVASATFLICYLAVFVVAIRLRHDIHASLPILIVGTLVMLLVILGFIYSLWSQGSRALIWIIGSLLLSLIVAMVMKRNKTV